MYTDYNQMFHLNTEIGSLGHHMVVIYLRIYLKLDWSPNAIPSESYWTYWFNETSIWFFAGIL